MSKIKELASIILTHTTEIDDYLVAEGIPSPSFDVDAATVLALPENLEKSQDIILDSVEDLHAHIVGPLLQLMRLISPAVHFSLS